MNKIKSYMQKIIKDNFVIDWVEHTNILEYAHENNLDTGDLGSIAILGCVPDNIKIEFIRKWNPPKTITLREHNRDMIEIEGRYIQKKQDIVFELSEIIKSLKETQKRNLKNIPDIIEVLEKLKKDI